MKPPILPSKHEVRGNGFASSIPDVAKARTAYGLRGVAVAGHRMASSDSGAEMGSGWFMVVGLVV